MAIPAILSDVPDVNPYIQYVAGPGQTVYPYPFPITQDSDLVVVINGTALPTDSGYTLSGVGNDRGGNVTLTAGSTVGDIVTLYRDIAIQRLTQFSQNSGFSSTAFNAEFNNLYLIAQQLQASVAQCLQVPNTNNPVPTTVLTPALYANKYLAFDTHGNPTPAVLTSSGSLTGAIIAALLSPITTIAALFSNQRTALEISKGVTPVNYSYAPYVDRRYGVVADGVTDDSAALNTAGSLGVPITMDPGNRYCAAAVTFTSSVYGAGAGVSTITMKLDGSNHVYPCTFNGSDIKVTGLTIRGASYLANNAGAALVNLGGTSGSHAVNVQMSNCEIFNATSFAAYCIYTDGFIFENNYVHDTGADGIHLGVTTAVRINKNYFSGCVDDAIALTSLGSAANQNQNVIVDGNFINMTATGISRCILLESLVDARIINNICYRVNASSGQGMIELVRLATGNASVNVTLQGNIVVNSAGSGDCIFIYGGNSNIRILDNYLSASAVGVNANAFTFGTIDNLEISGNTCISSGSNGINIPNTTVGNVLKVCRNKVNAYGSGLALNTNGAYNIILDNDVTYNGQNTTNVGISASPSTGGHMKQNVIAQSGGVTSGTNVSVGSNISVKDNVGWVTEASGSVSLATGATVTHGLNGAPAVVFLQQTGNTPSAVNPSNLGGTTFQVNFTGGGTQGFLWSAKTATALN